MTRWRIELRDARDGRDVGTIVVEAENLVKAKQHAVRVCRRHLSGGGDVYLEAKGHYTYVIVLGQDEVGEVRITRLGSGRPDVPDALRALKREPRRRRGAVGCSWSGPRRGTGSVPHLYLAGCRREMIQ